MLITMIQKEVDRLNKLCDFFCQNNQVTETEIEGIVLFWDEYYRADLLLSRLRGYNPPKEKREEGFVQDWIWGLMLDRGEIEAELAELEEDEGETYGEWVDQMNRDYYRSLGIQTASLGRFF